MKNKSTMSPMIDAEFKTLMRNIKHGKDLVASLSELHATGQFADVKLVCADGSLWSHRPLLAAVSPVLHSLLLNSLNDDVVTLILPQLRRVHLKLVLDYVYSGSMYLRATQMQYVIGVIEVLHLKCGVSVSKRNDSECAWVEEAEFNDVSDKKFGDFFIAPQLSNSTSILSSPCKESPKIKREFDCNSSAPESSLSCLPILYPREKPSKSLDQNKCNLESQRSPMSKDCITQDETKRLSIVENDDQDGLKEKTNDTTIQNRDKEEKATTHVSLNLDDQNDTVVVRPIPAESPEEIQKERRQSFDESYSVVEIETDSSDEDGEFDLPIHNIDPRDGFSREELSNARKDSIDSQSKVSSSGSLHGSSKCVMCGKEFQHNANLRVHLQSHLGARAQLKSCEKCDRNFRSSIEHDLHMNSHKYSNMLGIKRNPVEYKNKINRRMVHAKLVRKSIRIRTTSHKRGDLLDKLSDWIQYATWLEKKRKRNLALAKKAAYQRMLANNENVTEERREYKDIHTKSKSSMASSINSKFDNSQNYEELYNNQNYRNGRNSLSHDSFESENGSTPGAGKVKLKIKVDPSRYNKMLSSPTYCSSNLNNSHNQTETHVSQTSPLLQSALMASTQNNFNRKSATIKSLPIRNQKQFQCSDCPKQFSLRSSFIRHARKQHETDTRSRHFLQYLKNQATGQNETFDNLSFPNEHLPASRLNLNKRNRSVKLNSNEHDGYSITMKRKRKSDDGDASPFNAKPGKKIKLSLKLGKNKPKESYNQTAIPQHNSNEHEDWQQSLFQDASPASSPAFQDSQYLNSREENNSSESSLMNKKKSAFSPQYTFDSPSASPSTNTNAKSTKRNTVQDLTCPTCDKTFPAKSIFERHIKTYKHGRYEIYEQATPPPSYIPSSSDEPQLPHLNPVLQPTIEVAGREVNKYECHLCNQVFLRVRDLAKHRERMMCMAWGKK